MTDTPYGRLTAGQLAEAAEYVRHFRHSPGHLKSEMPNLAAMLDIAYKEPELHAAAWELVRELNTLFARFGYWDENERALRFAANYLQNQPEQRLDYIKSLNQLCAFILQRGHAEEAESIATEAVQQARLMGDFHQLAATMGSLIDCIYPRDIQRALALLATLESDPLGDRATDRQRAHGEIHIHLLRATLWRRSGQPAEKCLAEVRRAGILVESHGEIESIAVAHVHRSIGLHAWSATNYRAAIASFKKALYHIKKTNDLFDVSWIYGNMALVYWSSGALEQATKSVKISTRISYRLRAFYQFAHEVGNLALILFSQGRLREALKFANIHVHYAKNYCMENEQIRARGNRATLFFYLGSFAKAERDLQKVLDFSKSRNNQRGYAPTATNMARLYITLGRIEEAQRLLQEVHTIAENLNDTATRIIGLRAQAELQNSTDAIHTLKYALRLSIQSSRRLDAAGCYLTLYGLTHNHCYYQRGASLLEDIGASDWLRCPNWWHNAPRILTIV